MTSSGNGPDPFKDFNAYEDARKKFLKKAVWRPTLIRFGRGDTHTRALLRTYHRNFQMGSQVLLLYGKTPLFRLGTGLTLSVYASYKYYESRQDQPRMDEIEAGMKRANAQLAELEQEVRGQGGSLQVQTKSWSDLIDWGWFKKK